MNMPTSTQGMETLPTTFSASHTMTSVPMSMGGDSGCITSMFFNWHTIDSCFLSTSWHIRSQIGFFATCLAAFLLVVFLEFIRRVQRSFDQYLRDRSAFQQQKYGAPLNDAKEEDGDNEHDEEIVATSSLVGYKMRIELTRQTLKLDILMLYRCLRSLLFMLQFGVSYCIMLMSMYFNGFVILCILLGAFLGAAIFQQDVLQLSSETSRIGSDMRVDACC